MTCSCDKSFCFNCGACEIFDHRCVNGCEMFQYDHPLERIKKTYFREPTT